MASPLDKFGPRPLILPLDNDPRPSGQQFDEFCEALAHAAVKEYGVPVDPGHSLAHTATMSVATLACALHCIAADDQLRYQELLDRVCADIAASPIGVSDGTADIATWLTEQAWHEPREVYTRSRRWAYNNPSRQTIDILRAAVRVVRQAFTYADDPYAFFEPTSADSAHTADVGAAVAP